MIEDTQGPLRLLETNLKCSGSVCSDFDCELGDTDDGEGDDSDEGEEDGGGGLKEGLPVNRSARGVLMESESSNAERDNSVAETSFDTTTCMDLDSEKRYCEGLRKIIPRMEVENKRPTAPRSKLRRSAILTSIGVGPSGSFLSAREGWQTKHCHWAIDPIKRASSMELGCFDSTLWDLGNPLFSGGANMFTGNLSEEGPPLTKH